MAKRDPHFPIDVKALPASWAHALVGELVVTIRPGFASGKHTDERVGVPHLRPMNISREGRLDLSVLLHVPESKDLRVRPGDVLFNNTNSRELVGKTAPINDGGSADRSLSRHLSSKAKRRKRWTSPRTRRSGRSRASLSCGERTSTAAV